MSVAVSANESIGGPARGRTVAGRLCQANLTNCERNYAIATHVLPLGLFLLGFWPVFWLPTLVIWLSRKKDSVFNDDHGREASNFMISFGLWHIVTGITLIGFVPWPVLWVIGGVSAIRGAIAAGRSEYFRYPMTVRLIK